MRLMSKREQRADVSGLAGCPSVLSVSQLDRRHVNGSRGHRTRHLHPSSGTPGPPYCDDGLASEAKAYGSSIPRRMWRHDMAMGLRSWDQALVSWPLGDLLYTVGSAAGARCKRIRSG